jgi:hypothetical protein
MAVTLVTRIAAIGPRMMVFARNLIVAGPTAD